MILKSSQPNRHEIDEIINEELRKEGIGSQQLLDSLYRFFIDWFENPKTPYLTSVRFKECIEAGKVLF